VNTATRVRRIVYDDSCGRTRRDASATFSGLESPRTTIRAVPPRRPPTCLSRGPISRVAGGISYRGRSSVADERQRATDIDQAGQAVTPDPRSLRLPEQRRRHAGSSYSAAARLNDDRRRIEVALNSSARVLLMPSRRVSESSWTSDITRSRGAVTPFSAMLRRPRSETLARTSLLAGYQQPVGGSSHCPLCPHRGRSPSSRDRESPGNAAPGGR